MSTEISFDGVEQLPLRKFTEDAYLNYSMYVIMDRALPYIGDGLKPVNDASSTRCLSWVSRHRPNTKNQHVPWVTYWVNTIRMAIRPVTKLWC